MDKYTHFGRVKAGYDSGFSSKEVKKPENGCLVLIEGTHEIILKNDLPFPLLQTIKKQYISKGYKAINLRIKYKKL